MGCNKLPSQLTYMVIFLIRTGRNSLIYFLGPAVSSISACQCPSHCHRWWPYEHHKRSGQHQLTQMFALLAALNQSHLRLSCMSTKTIKIPNYRIPSDVGDNNQELLEPQNGIIQTSAWSPVLLLVIQASVSKANVVPCFKDVWWKLYSTSTNVKQAAERKRLKLRYVHRLQLVFHQSVQDEPPQSQSSALSSVFQ